MNLNDRIDAMTPAQQDRLMQFGSDLQDWADEETRETYTTFGYKHGGIAIMCVWMFAPLVLVTLGCVIAAIVWLPSHPLDYGATAMRMYLYMTLFVMFAPMFIVPFIFQKPRKALQTVAILVGVLGVIMLGSKGMDLLFTVR